MESAAVAVSDGNAAQGSHEEEGDDVTGRGTQACTMVRAKHTITGGVPHPWLQALMHGTFCAGGA